jgi:hypothetical protein
MNDSPASKVQQAVLVLRESDVFDALPVPMRQLISPLLWRETETWTDLEKEELAKAFRWALMNLRDVPTL